MSGSYVRVASRRTPMMPQLKTLHVPGPVVWRHLVNSSGGPTPGGLTTPGTALINPPVFFEDDGGEMYLHMLMGTSQVRRVGRVAACAKARRETSCFPGKGG